MFFAALVAQNVNFSLALERRERLRLLKNLKDETASEI